MSNFRLFAAAAAVVFAIGCGIDRVPDEGGGADGFGDQERTTPAERTSAPGAGAMALSEEDRQFVEQASQGNRMEVALGHLAEEKAQREDVKQFGEQLAADHSAALRELQASIGGGPDAAPAQMRSGAQMTELSGEAAQVQEQLEGLSGAEFDRTFLQEMVKHHQQDVQTFERQAQQTDNAQVRAFIEQTLPTLREHLERAQQLQQQARQSNR